MQLRRQLFRCREGGVMEMTIRDFNPGESAEIVGFAPGDAAYRKRILEMGLTKGTLITIVKKAPLGDPVEITVRGYQLSLRKEEAAILLLARCEG